MDEFEDLLQKADWKKEKHMPVIAVLEAKGDEVRLEASVGKEIGHPNTTAHHIEWIEVYFKPDSKEFPYLVGRYDFAAHGASTDGADSSTVYTKPAVTTSFKTETSGVIYAKSYCNIHGLWVNSEEITL